MTGVQTCALPIFCDISNIIAAELNPERRDYIDKTYGITTTTCCQEAAKKAHVVILEVKPQVMEAVLREIGPATKGTLLISIAAGISLNYIESRLPAKSRVIRVMPNTPAQVGEGASVYSLGKNATKADAATAEKLLSAVGTCFAAEEKLLNAVTGLSGSGPAYVFEFLSALIDAGVYVGLPRELAANLASQTIKGALEMFLRTSKHPEKLKDMVTSPGGTTVEALAVLAKGGFKGMIIEAVKAATEKSEKLER